MSAATPPPPSSAAGGQYPPSDASSVYSTDQNGARSNRSSVAATPIVPDGSRHIDDLIAEADRRALNMLLLPIGHLVNAATDCARYADNLTSFRKRDQAYVEYLVAMNIATDIIQRHKDWPSFGASQNRHSSVYKTYWRTLNLLKTMDERFEKIKTIIRMENQRNGILPRAAQPQPKLRPASVQSARPALRTAARPDEMFLDSASQPSGTLPATRPASSDFSDFTNSLDSNSTTSLHKPKPQVRPKPDSLHGHMLPPSLAAGTMSSGIADLNERFAKLRTASNVSSPTGASNPQNSWASNGISKPMSSAAPPMPPPPRRMGGPRDLPMVPPKLPLNTSVALNMPKAPSPTYSPARNMQTPHGINPPRSTARSTVRSNSIASVSASSASFVAPNSENGSYFPLSNGTTTITNGRAKRQGSIGLPSEGRGIEPKILLDYMNLYKILIIDVRDRHSFDDGHIDSVGTICISPESLREDMTDEDLERAVLLSPDNELSLFSRRDQFDLVVYYDEETQTPSFLTKATRTPQEDALRYVFDGLWERNVVKTLRRPPLLLIGGLDAWSDLLGRAALRTSTTVSMTGIKSKPPSRKPVPSLSPAAMLAMERRRRREYNPLDAEEERRWQESARKESVYIPTEEEGGESEASFYRTQEEFFRRFPAVGLERESMTSAPSSSTGIQYPVQPLPSRPAPITTYTSNNESQSSLPSRPAPTAPRVSYSGAHDRTDAPNNTAALSRSQQLRPYIPPKEMLHNIRLPRTGLINFGVTCYMNATIQCLSATIPLSTQFRNDNYTNYIQRDNWKGARGLFPQHFANLIKHLWLGDVDSVRPTTFRQFCARLDSKYGIEQQQDAKEFLEFTLDYLHEDMNINWKNDPPHVLSKDEEDTRERLPRGYAAMIEWQRYTKRSKSLIQDLFAGQHYSKITCLKCGHTSTTYETFFSISVEIPRSGQGDIYSSLRSYCKEEVLDGDDRPKCEKCNKPREHTKQITITRAPRYLVVHFKRFTAKLSKIHTPVTFPLTNLDITPFVLPPLTPQERDFVARETNDPGFRTRGTEESMKTPFLYDAYGVVRHIGQSLGSGHYIALGRDPGRVCWRQFNDGKVLDFEGEGRVVGEGAYVIFFERVGVGLGAA